MAEPVSISAVVLSHNEAANLPRCLRALRDCAEIVVVDDGSTDDSRRIAAACGARVVEHPFVSFADQRNWAMEQAGLRHDWVLHLDADEVYATVLRKGIDLVSHPETTQAEAIRVGEAPSPEESRRLARRITRRQREAT